jgi:CheY-like chemotaxis protein
VALDHPRCSCGETAMDDLARRRRILAVDDCKDLARLLSRCITHLGHDVRTARDGLEGVEAASEFRPDVVLMDLNMPILDGYDAARRIRDRSRTRRSPWSP